MPMFYIPSPTLIVVINICYYIYLESPYATETDAACGCVLTFLK